MEHVTQGLSTIFSRKDSRLVFAATAIGFFTVLLLVQNGSAAYAVWSFTTLSIGERISTILQTLFNITGTFSSSSLLISLLSSLLGGINISLAYTYMKVRGEIIARSGLYSGIGLFMAFIGIGCAACGTAFLSVILSFFGLSAMLHVLPYQGQEIGYIGLIFLCIATYSLASKVSAPATC